MHHRSVERGDRSRRHVALVRRLACNQIEHRLCIPGDADIALSTSMVADWCSILSSNSFFDQQVRRRAP